MGDDRFLTNPVTDPRLAPYATSAQPVWLWSTDGSRILWCNAAGAAVLGVADLQRLEKPFSPMDPHRREVAQLVRRLGTQTAPRLERLRGFGSRFGQLMTFTCAQLALANGETAVLLVRMEPFTGTTVPAAAPSLQEALAVVSSPGPAEPAAAEPPSVDAPVEATQSRDSTDRPEEASPAQGEPLEYPSTLEILAPVSENVAPVVDTASRGEAIVADAPIASRDPLRFVWQIDSAGRFALTSEAFLHVAGERTAAVQERSWPEVAAALALDADGRIAQAIGNGETFSAVALSWPLQGQAHGRVELSGMPVYDATRNLAGYRGFGIYRPAASLADAHTVEAEADPVAEAPLLLDEPPPTGEPLPEQRNHSTSAAAAEMPAAADEDPSPAETEIVEPPQNVVPFPLASETRGPSLSPGENHAFDEIARRLTQKFDELNTQRPASATNADQPVADHETPETEQIEQHDQATTTAQPAWLAAAAQPARGDSTRERMLLDLMPSGILIYRLDRLLYANRPFLERTGFDSLQALQNAGGLDALYVERGPGSASSASDDGMPLTIAHSADDHAPSDARLFSILWDGDTAHALILQGTTAAASAPPAARSEPPTPPPTPEPIAAPPPADNPYEAILETATDGIVLFDRSGAIISSNRSAQTLLDMSPNELAAQNFAELFSSESQRVVLDYFESLENSPEANRNDHGRDVLARERKGNFVPLSMTMGRTDSDHFFAVFRDLSPVRKSETELLNARRTAERATSAKADALARISREIREPLNTIIGFAGVMIEERFGALTNDRYAAYLKDIRAAGERAIAVLDDIVSISGIETGQTQLKLVSQNLNDMVEQCVGALQPQANRERVIIRTSLARTLPQVLADTQALRQITMNIVTSSIRCSKAGGQVIVSTAPSENGGAVLRVRDTGRGLNQAELTAANGTNVDGTLDRGAIDLSLARALAEANRAQFQIKSTDNAGTLIEVAFTDTHAIAR